MKLAKRYRPAEAEPRLQAGWDDGGIYHYDRSGEGPVFSIDTPPPTVSGNLHLGHVYSYSHTDFIARYKRMRGARVFYPMGFDDNGLPTERLVERRLGARAGEIGRRAFVERCLALSAEAERDYEALFRRLGLSIDWRHTYRTIAPETQRLSQHAFLDMLARDQVYRRRAPTIWCPTCRTAIAQAELDDLARETTLHTLAFERPDGGVLPVATTRPELLPACVAVFVHPDDARYAALVGQSVTVPLTDRAVTVMTDPAADPETGTGAVMCCTFGDQADVGWWYTHGLPLRQVLDASGRLTEAAGPTLAGLTTDAAQARLVERARQAGRLLDQAPVDQSVRVHERCDTAVEYLVTPQWFVRLLDDRAALLEAGEGVRWHPPYMAHRYREWVEGLGWDWCISRQRTFGVPFPVWVCDACEAVVPAAREALPVDPTSGPPPGDCGCGGTLRPETDVMDTWATSSLSPQIAGRWLDDPALYGQVFPFSLRPQAHEIIRTWAFYTVVRSRQLEDRLPWSDVMISGWGLAPAGGKISKSRGGGPMAPLEMVERYSADAVRYWAASTALGKDAVISEERIAAGEKLTTKLWNVARLAERFIDGDRDTLDADPGALDGVPDAAAARRAVTTPADRWMLSRASTLTETATAALEALDYAAALHAVERFFWTELADNYLEMAKGRLYAPDDPRHDGARLALHRVLLTTVKLLAPLLPHVTEEIYQALFAASDGARSVHRAAWPTPDPRAGDPVAEALGARLVEVATAVRRYKSEAGLSLGKPLPRLVLACDDAALKAGLRAAEPDLISVTRAERVTVAAVLPQDDDRLVRLAADGPVSVAVVAAGPVRSTGG